MRHAYLNAVYAIEIIRPSGRPCNAVPHFSRQCRGYCSADRAFASESGGRLPIDLWLLGDTPSAILPLALSESLVKRLGSLLGLLALFRTVGFAAGPIIAGGIFDRSGSYTGTWCVFIAMEVVAMFAMLATLPVAEEKARSDMGAAAGAEPFICAD